MFAAPYTCKVKKGKAITLYVLTVEPLNKGHFGDSINSAVLSFTERLSSPRRFSMYGNHREW